MDLVAVDLQPEFLQDIPNLSKAGIKIYIVLRYYRILTGDKHGQGFAWVHPPYEVLRNESGLKSNSSIEKGIKELYELGWISEIKTGGIITDANGKKLGRANQYCISDIKVDKNINTVSDKKELKNKKKLSNRTASKKSIKKIVRNMEQKLDAKE